MQFRTLPWLHHLADRSNSAQGGPSYGSHNDEGCELHLIGVLAGATVGGGVQGKHSALAANRLAHMWFT